MTFTGIPLGTALLLAVGAAAALVLLHRLRVRPVEVRVVTTLFWAQTVERSRARTLWGRFRHVMTFLLLLAFCLLLVFALWRPEWSQDPADRVYEVIVVDAGMTMGARDIESNASRLDAAREAMLAESDRLAWHDRLAVIVADPVPRLIHRFEDARAALEGQLSDVQPAVMPAARDDAIRLGRTLLRGRRNGQLVLVTDRPEVIPNFEGHVVDVGQSADNAAILSVVFEPDRTNPLQGRLGIRAGYWGRSPRDVTVEVHRGGGAPVYRVTQRVRPGGTFDVRVPEVPADGDTLEVRLLPGDLVAADDHVAVLVPLRSPIRVGSDTDVPAALRIALQADPSVQWVADAGRRDIDVLMGRDEPDRSQPAVVISNDGPDLPAGAVVMPTATGLKLLRGLRLDGMTCGGGPSVGPSIDAEHSILSAGDQTVAGLTAAGGTAAFYVCPALLAETGDIVRRPAFAVLVSRAMRYLAGWSEDPIVLTTARVVVDPLWTQRHGHADAAWLMPGSRRVSDLTRPGPATSSSDSTRVKRWSWPALFEIALVLATGLFLLESFLYARGRIS